MPTARIAMLVASDPAAIARAGETIIDPLDHLGWAEGIAKRRARRFKFRADSDEEAEIVQEVHLAVCRLARRFDPSRVPPGGDPAGQFRGWACQWVLTAATRHCRRLLNGGTYWTRREHAGARPIKAVPLSSLKAPIRAAERATEPAEEWSVCDTSPDT